MVKTKISLYNKNTRSVKINTYLNKIENKNGEELIEKKKRHQHLSGIFKQNHLIHYLKLSLTGNNLNRNNCIYVWIDVENNHLDYKKPQMNFGKHWPSF